MIILLSSRLCHIKFLNDETLEGYPTFFGLIYIDRQRLVKKNKESKMKATFVVEFQVQGRLY